MKLSVKSRYALEAMLEIARCDPEGQVPVPVREIARRRQISERFLAQILRTLRHHGLLKSVRGATGGFVLARDVRDIAAGDVVRAVEGARLPVACVDVVDDADTACHLRGWCSTYALWQAVAARIHQTLDHTSLADLLQCMAAPEAGEATG